MKQEANKSGSCNERQKNESPFIMKSYRHILQSASTEQNFSIWFLFYLSFLEETLKGLGKVQEAVNSLFIQSHCASCRAGWSTSWNQDYWEKNQQPQICRWPHAHDRNQRGTKKPLDESKEESKKSGLNSTFRKLRSWHLVPPLHGK